MKIDDSLKKAAGLSVGTTQTRSGKGAEKAGAVSQAPASSSDTVTLSSTLESISQTGGNSVFDANKVEQIKAAIADGTFKVNAENVANGLIETVRDLIQTSRK